MSVLRINDPPGAPVPSWYAATSPPPPPALPLRGHARADICVIGAGYTGLSAALRLARAGCSVRVLEARHVGFGASGRNGGQAAPGQRVEPDVLAARHGAPTARALWEIGRDAMDHLRRLVAEQAIACDWRDGVLEAARTDHEAARLRAAPKAMARDYGYDALLPLDRQAVVEETGSTVFTGGLLDRGAAHLHPLKLVRGLARAATAAGAVLHEDSEALRLRDGPVVQTARGAIAAEHVVLAANGYLGQLCAPVSARVMPINNFIIATAPLGSAGAGILPRDVAAQDTRFVVNYWRRSADDRLLFGGGESYGRRFPRDIAAAVRPRMAAIYPQLARARIDHAWGGTLAITRSRLPVFARPGPGLWSASGFSGHGLALGLYAGEMIAAAILGVPGRFDTMAAASPRAFPGGDRLRPALLAAAMTWFSLRDRLGI